MIYALSLILLLTQSPSLRHLPIIVFIHTHPDEWMLWLLEQQMARERVGGGSSGNVWGPRRESKVVYPARIYE